MHTHLLSSVVTVVRKPLMSYPSNIVTQSKVGIIYSLLRLLTRKDAKGQRWAKILKRIHSLRSLRPLHFTSATPCASQTECWVSLSSRWTPDRIPNTLDCKCLHWVLFSTPAFTRCCRTSCTWSTHHTSCLASDPRQNRRQRHQTTRQTSWRSGYAQRSSIRSSWMLFTGNQASMMKDTSCFL